MKRYKLKKDLPTFEAGEIFDISANGDLVMRGECISDCILAYSARALQKFPNILTEWFEEIPEETKTIWDLKKGDQYYVVYSDGTYRGLVWDNDPQDIKYRLNGATFLTCQEVEKEFARREARAIIEQDAKGFKPDWEDLDQEKWFACYDHRTLELESDYDNTAHYPGVIFFASEDDIENSFDKHRKEWLTLLGVEEKKCSTH